MKWNSVQGCALTALLSLSIHTHAQIGGVVTQPSIKKATGEASPNEFPRMVGTVKRDDSGFELSWNNTSVGLQNLAGSFGNVVCKLDILGLFAACVSQSQKLQTVDTISAASLIEQDKYNEVADLSHHHAQADIRSADESSAKVASKTESQSPEKKEAINNNLVAAKSDEDDGDWRKHRQWWQRGTPVL